MNNISDFMQTPIYWEFKKKKALLKSNATDIVSARITKRRVSFLFAEKKYSIKNNGFYRPITIIKEGKKITGQLKHFFRGNTGMLELTGGNKYYIKYQNAVFVKLSIYSSENKELIRYKLISKKKASVHIHNKQITIPEHDLILLLVLGCFFFKGILIENKVTAIESVIFSQTLPAIKHLVAEPA